MRADLGEARRLPEAPRGIALEDEVEDHRVEAELAGLAERALEQGAPDAAAAGPGGDEIPGVRDRVAALGVVGVHVAAAGEAAPDLGDQHPVLVLDPDRPSVVDAHRRPGGERAALLDRLGVGGVDVQFVGKPQLADFERRVGHRHRGWRLRRTRAGRGGGVRACAQNQ